MAFLDRIRNLLNGNRAVSHEQEKPETLIIAFQISGNSLNFLREITEKYGADDENHMVRKMIGTCMGIENNLREGPFWHNGAEAVFSFTDIRPEQSPRRPEPDQRKETTDRPKFTVIDGGKI